MVDSIGQPKGANRNLQSVGKYDSELIENVCSRAKAAATGIVATHNGHWAYTPAMPRVLSVV